MQDALAWISANWMPVLLGVLALVQVINKATDRWDEFSGPTWKRWLLLLTEVGSVVTSKEHSGLFGLFKLPLNPYGGRPKGVKPPPVVFPPGPTLLLLLGGLIVADGCATTWEGDMAKAIRTATTAAEGGWNTARAIYKSRCGALLNTCSTAAELAQCDGYQRCAASRRDHATAFRSVLEMCALASEALSAYEQLKETSKPGDGGAAAGVLKAEVQERVDRAVRESSIFMRRLEKDGLDQ